MTISSKEKNRQIIENMLSILKLTKDNPETRKAIADDMFSDKGFENLSKMIKLTAEVEQFLRDNKIHSSETIYQTDRVIENAYKFIEDLANIIGYPKDEDDDDNE